jgi:hypothetical protein
VQVIATLETDANVSVDIPKFPENGQFSVVGANKSTSSSTSISMINGKTTTDKTVSTRFMYQIQFNTQNSVVLPPLSITIDGTPHESNSISFSVGEKSEKTSAVSVRFLRERANIYIGEQAILTVRVQIRANEGAQLTNDGYVGFLNTVQEKLSEKFTATPLVSSPKTSQEVINGQNYFIYDLPFNIVPTDTGKIVLNATPLTYIIEDMSQGRDPFDGFFGFSSIRQQQAIATAPSLSYSIKSVPRPTPKSYTGIIGEVKITGNLSKDTIAAGESATLRLTLSGKMPANLLGELELSKNDKLDIFPPERTVSSDTTASGLSSKKQYSYMIVPKIEGEHTISVPEISWFDPKSGTFKVAKVKDFSFFATPGDFGDKVQTRRYLTQTEIATLGDDIRYIKTKLSENDAMNNFSKKNLLNSFIIIWIAALALVLIKLKQVFLPQNADKLKQSKAFSLATRALTKISCGKDVKNSEISIILQYLSSKTGKECGSMKYDEVETVLISRKVSKSTAENLTKYLRDVEMARYSFDTAGTARHAPTNTKELSRRSLSVRGIEVIKQIEREFK